MPGLGRRIGAEHRSGLHGGRAEMDRLPAAHTLKVTQLRMEQLGGDYYRIGGWVLIRYNGSRGTAPRTKCNEKAFCARHYYKSQKAKTRKNDVSDKTPPRLSGWFPRLCATRYLSVYTARHRRNPIDLPHADSDDSSRVPRLVEQRDRRGIKSVRIGAICVRTLHSRGDSLRGGVVHRWHRFAQISEPGRRRVRRVAGVVGWTAGMSGIE